MHRFIVATLFCAALASCSGASTEQPVETVVIAPGVLLTLPKPSEMGQTLEAAQLVTAQYGDATFTFEGHVSATKERFLLVGLDAMGRKALSVSWSDSGVKAETAPWLPDQVRPENMIADMVILYWPEEIVHRSLGSGATLMAGPYSRSVFFSGQEVFHADYAGDTPWKGSLKYRNLAWNYEIHVESVEVAP